MIESVNHIDKPLALLHLYSASGLGSVKKFLHFRGVLVVFVLVETLFDEFKRLSLSTGLDFELKDE
jgi:hypothetical protein